MALGTERLKFVWRGNEGGQREGVGSGDSDRRADHVIVEGHINKFPYVSSKAFLSFQVSVISPVYPSIRRPINSQKIPNPPSQTSQSDLNALRIKMLRVSMN